METRPVPQMTCEQIYSLWVTEPELMKLLDLRSRDEFEKGHIPGAQNVDLDQLVENLKSLGNKIAVIMTSHGQEAEVVQRCEDFDNFTLFAQCQRWTELQGPLVGDGVLLAIRRGQELQREGRHMNRDIIFHQLFEPESSTYTYIIADQKTKEAAIIDPVLETVDRDLKLIDELGLKLIYALDTHIHADHVTGAGELRKRRQVKTAVSAEAGVDCVDIPLEDGQELLLGDKTIKVIATPGHTNTCLSFAFEGLLFTGDALLIRSCGRTDFQQGDSAKLHQSVHGKLFQLPDDTLVYPGHDYRGFTSSTIGAEKKYNARLNDRISVEDFKKIMSELKLANPKKIHEAVPANLACGRPQDSRILHPQVVDGIPEITVEDLYNHIDQVKANKIRLIDVRRPEEFNNELGHIEGSELVTLGPELSQFLEKGDRTQEIVFVCRSGGRSGTATAESRRLGYKSTINMAGGMIRWNEKNLPVEKK